PLVLWRSRRTLEQLYALSAARTRLWHGVTGNDRWAMLGGQLVVPVEQARPPFWVWNAALRQLYLSSYHLARELIPYYLDALARYRIVYLYGYASSMTALALEALRLGRRDLRLRVAITNSEPLLKHQRAAIADAFGCPVRETYGMAETVAAASECDAGALQPGARLLGRHRSGDRGAAARPHGCGGGGARGSGGRAPLRCGQAARRGVRAPRGRESRGARSPRDRGARYRRPGRAARHRAVTRPARDGAPAAVDLGGHPVSGRGALYRRVSRVDSR